MQLNHVRDLTVEVPLASGHSFLAAASGMVLCGKRLSVVADDAHCLAVFDLDTLEPGRLIPLITGELPHGPAQRKKVKPDFEILLELPGSAPGTAETRLLALGSGSTAQRMRGAVIDLSADDGPAAVRLIDLQPLFAALASLVPELNLEGAVLRDGRLLLFNRGNMEFPASHVLAVPLAVVLDGGPVLAQLLATLTLPTLSGVPLSVTDACWLEGGHYLLSAVAEATADSYADGALVGAAIVELDAQFNLLRLEPLDPTVKVEGIAARATEAGLQLLCVTDSDDPDRPSALYTGLW